ncbi:MAG: sel1 repeat family protein [Planctomycetes bacterium]|nr:sel1 repeat family protein [Planctomycetota bacterium]
MFVNRRISSCFSIALLLWAAAFPVRMEAGEQPGSVVPIDAVNELVESAARGEPAAMLQMAQLHEQGVRGMDGTLIIPRNLTESFKLYVALGAGDLIPEALFAAGICHEMGLGITADPAKAVEYYQKAVRLNHPPALLKMAELLMDGRLFRKDVDRGLEFLEAASRGGSPDGAHQLALVHLQGRFGKPVDAARGVQWLIEAATRGHVAAIQAMAELRQAGIPGILERDAGEAMKWFLILAKVGNLPQAAAQKIQALRNAMTQAEAQEADDNAVKWLRELEAAQAKIREEAQQAAERRFAAFNAARSGVR